MEMTWLGMGAAVFLAISCYVGFRRGFIKEAVSLMFVVLSMVIVWTINPYVSDFLKNETPVYKAIKAQCEETITAQITEDGGVGEQMQQSVIESLPLPQALKETMEQNNNSQVYEYLAVDTFTDYVADYLAVTITNGIAFVLSLMLASIAIRLLSHALNLVAQLPVLRGVNRVAGIVVGLLRGVIMIWIALLVMTIFINTSIGKQAMELVEQDPLLTFFYDNNLFTQIFLSIFYGK